MPAQFKVKTNPRGQGSAVQTRQQHRESWQCRVPTGEARTIKAFTYTTSIYLQSKIKLSSPSPKPRARHTDNNSEITNRHQKKLVRVVTQGTSDPMNNNLVCKENSTFSLAVLLSPTGFLVSISKICALEKGCSFSGHWPVLFRTSCATLLCFIGQMQREGGFRNSLK